MTSLRVNLRDGTTESCDLSTQEGADLWRLLRSGKADQITGVSLIANGINFSVPIPVDFESVGCDIETIFHRDGRGSVVADAMKLSVDNICIRLLIYRERSKVVKLSIEKQDEPES